MRKFDAAEAGSAPDNLGPLPEWDLSDLYPGAESDEIKADMAFIARETAAFAADYEGRLGGLSADEFARCIARNEVLSGKIGRVFSFAGLSYYQNTTDAGRAKFLSDVQAQITDATAAVVFFDLELNRLEDAVFDAWYAASAEVARYKPVFDRMRAMRPHQLSDELAKVFGEKISLFARITNTLAKEKAVHDKWRKMPTPQTGRHLANDVEPAVVEALRNAVVAAYPRLSHRYYALKAKWLGLDALEVWDRNAPLPQEDDRLIGWNEARDTVLEAYGAFDPRLAALGGKFFGNGWIDAGVKPGKSPGAFAHPTVTDVHPYLLLNYLGKPRDVMTLAHELGHGVHQLLAAPQGEMLSSTPLTLAETASVFGEMLTFQKLLAGARDKAMRKRLLAGKVEDMINTVVRQIAFYDFECKLHAARADGELTPDDINALWMSVQGESLGPVFNFMEGYETFWAYIPHFIHSPFYVYAYAFGDGLVNALYAVYAEDMKAGKTGFQDKYFEMLKAGGSKHHSALLAPFGLDASDPAFWDKGLSMIEGMIDELEAMED